MIENLPHWIEFVFLLTFGLTLVLFYHSNGKPRKLVTMIMLWSIVQSLIAYTGFYQSTESMPPRFIIVIIPAMTLVIFGLLPKQQKWFLKKRRLEISTFLHSVRLPIEIILFGLFAHEMIPELMTYQGRNYDIIIGIMAPITGWLFIRKKMSRKKLLIWNIFGLGFVLFIMFNGILSAELPFQQFGFDQPNRAVNYFPFVLLPATIVPIVIWTHLSDILKLRIEIMAIKHGHNQTIPTLHSRDRKNTN